ncbi:hypothetical protein IT400_00620 [Candidatus Nomurabacteria bacterium]|nr:hypothetical protein [Candidatus Nomurabacteria bacterium]
MQNQTKGNTMIEVIIVIGIVVLLLAVISPVISSFREKQILKNTAEEVKVLLDEARINSVSSKDSNFYSVRFQADRVVFFKGNPPVNLSDPETKTVTFDSRINIIPANVVLQGSGTDVVFDRLTGNTSTYGTITLELVSSPSTRKIITVNALGVVSIN